MNLCDPYRRLLLLEDSGELTEPERGELLAHLASCQECRRFQADLVQLSARAVTALEVPPPKLDLPRLEARARDQSRRVLRVQFAVILSAAAALLLAVLVPGLWMTPPRGNGNPTVPQHVALLSEWQFWLVSYIGPQGHDSSSTPYRDDWNKREFARHLLVLEGLLPEEDAVLDEDFPEIIPGEPPPITRRGCNRPVLLRS